MKTRIPTSELKPNILHRIFKRASVPRCARELTSRYGTRIPFNKVSEYNNPLLFIELRNRGYTPDHTLKIYYKI